MKNLMIAFFCFISCSLLAQDFQYPINSFSRNKTSYFILKDGTEIEASLHRINYRKSLIASVTITDASNQRKSLQARDIDHMYLMPSELGRLAAAMDQVMDFQQHGKDRSVDNDKISEGYILFESTVTQVKKKEEVMLLQLLNPHFAGKIRVYHDPRAKQTTSVGVGGFTVAGGNAKSYYVKKDNQNAFLLKRNAYRKEGKNLFGDCPDFFNSFNPNWSNFNNHVSAYNNSCD